MLIKTKNQTNRMLGRGWQLMIDLGLIKTISLIDDNRIIEILEYIHDATTIPVVGDTSTVVDMPGRVLQDLERRLHVFHQEHFQLTQTYTQIAIGELVGNVKTKRTELASLERDTME